MEREGGRYGSKRILRPQQPTHANVPVVLAPERYQWLRVADTVREIKLRDVAEAKCTFTAARMYRWKGCIAANCSLQLRDLAAAKCTFTAAKCCCCNVHIADCIAAKCTLQLQDGIVVKCTFTAANTEQMQNRSLPRALLNSDLLQTAKRFPQFLETVM